VIQIAVKYFESSVSTPPTPHTRSMVVWRYVPQLSKRRQDAVRGQERFKYTKRLQGRSMLRWAVSVSVCVSVSVGGS